MTDYASKMAKVLTEYSVPIVEGDIVVIDGPVSSEPLIEALYGAVLERGGNPMVTIGLDNLPELFFRKATDTQMEFLPARIMADVQTMTVYYSIRAHINTKRFSKIDPQRLAHYQKARKSFMDVYNEREAKGDLRWCIAPWPTQSAAQEAEMGYLDYSEFVFSACGLNEADPVTYWQGFRDNQMRLVDWLADKHHAEVRAPGIELSFEFGDRKWISCHGERNFPDGEIYTCPIEDSVNGHVAFNYPTMYGGREINGVQLTFRDGLVVEASAKKGEDYLFSQLDMDDGARRLGEFAIGTNMYIQEFTREILFDEKIGGTIHMALGRAFPRAGGLNQSSIHWDMVHGMRQDAEITVDGNVIYRNGAFVI
ncbi:MAG: aminopeptidase [Anaerolineae bacterium]|nr:aminopeptidase [Anaerolineae bacterium]